MKHAFIIGFSALVLTGVIMGLTQNSYAYRGNPAVRGPNYTAERHDAMEKAFEKNDFTAWKNLMQGRGRVLQIITKDNFAQFAKAHELAEQGKITEANKIRADLGLGNGGGMGRGCGMNR